MPLYGFECQECGTVTDKIFHHTETRPDHVPCENCGRNANYRMFDVGYIRIGIEANGRVGYKQLLKDGKRTVRSATRERYEHLAGSRTAKEIKEMGRDISKSVLTKEAENANKGRNKKG